MQELNTINSWLGGHALTLKATRLLAGEQRAFTVCEIGSGGGDNLEAIRQWALKTGRSVHCTGIDINPECVAYAQERYPDIVFHTGDYRQLQSASPPDIIFSSLFCHHFGSEILPEQMAWMADHCRLGFFVNDLHRHPLAYYSIRLITGLFSRSALVKNDAPLSVLRGFRKAEWEKILQQANLPGATVQWEWAFRWRIQYKKQDADAAGSEI